MGLENAKENVKIDGVHGVGRNMRSSKARAIVCKFNYYPDKEQILANARKLKETGIGVSEQFPDEILKVRKRLYPTLKKAKQEGKRVKMVRDKLFATLSHDTMSIKLQTAYSKLLFNITIFMFYC